MTRNKKLYINILTALASQAVVLACGFILPRYILEAFGSDVNGLVTSITRFLSVIAFLELGVGPVVQSNLYKPLAEGDREQQSRILVSTRKFYRRIAYIFVAYIAVLFFAYPQFNGEYEFFYTASLLLIISISSFVQYYFGLTYQIFLNADQKVYIGQVSQIVTVVLNTVISVILIKLGCQIHTVKLFSALIFVLRPLFLSFYVRKNYRIDWKIKYDKEPIKQKWNGFAQHLAAVVCSEIAVILLTVFVSYQAVSVYSTYYLVIGGITNIIMTAVSGLESYWGNIIANNEKALLLKSFKTVETVIHTAVVFIYGCTAALITPFVSVYVNGLEDAESYYMPLFGIILSVAYAFQCLRIPYFRIIKAAGHYKETQNGAFISMGVNIIVSVILVLIIDNKLLGVALGTAAAMLCHTAYLAWYLRKRILKRPFIHFIRYLAADAVIFTAAYLVSGFIKLTSVTYLGWFIMAVEAAAVVFAVVALLSLLFHYRQIKAIFTGIMNKAGGVLSGKKNKDAGKPDGGQSGQG